METTKNKTVIKGIEIKPGMIIQGLDVNGHETTLIAFPTVEGIAFVNYNNINSWDKDYTIFIDSITRIRDISNGVDLTDGKLLWSKDHKQVFEVSMEEIAEKFGVDVKYIRIKP